MTLKYYLILPLLAILSLTSQGQNKGFDTFGKGLTLMTNDSSLYVKFRFRIQNRYDGSFHDDGRDKYYNRFYVRRSRLKFDGYVLNPKIVYKFEYDLVNSAILDAVIKWNFYKNLTLWFGQTKLPGNVERVISSQNLQFVDRSLLNSQFNIDRDKGVQLRYKYNLGKMHFRHAFAISQGEGRNKTAYSDGNDYTYHIEWLPFGTFTNKGEYFESDLEREKKPKLMLGFTYDFNDNAINRRGQLGDELAFNRDLEAIFADIVFKFNGISLLAEYVDKSIDNGLPYDPVQPNVDEQFFIVGQAYNVQMGYLFKKNFEFALRRSEMMPTVENTQPGITDHTFAFSKYFVRHALKLQTDITQRLTENKADEYIYRLQLELAF